MSKNRILFILKHRESGGYGSWAFSPTGVPMSSGLSTSVHFIAEMLTDAGIQTKVVTVIDNNQIDREVTLYKPTHVIIEAFWVVPEKFDVLKNLHPNVTWIVRNHSKSEFLANEGNAFGWLMEYMKRGVKVACNSTESFNDILILAKTMNVPQWFNMVLYLPNHYPLHRFNEWKSWYFDLTDFRLSSRIDIGCFGAIRPLKNHMNQALAAICFADNVRGKLHFHVNGNRTEVHGDQVLRNLRGLFAQTPNHKLVEHVWLEHADFKKIVGGMDIVSQVSFSETFNIVSADAVGEGVVVVGSKQIEWLPEDSQANPNSVLDIKAHYSKAWADLAFKTLAARQRRGLELFNRKSLTIWLSQF